MTLQIAGTPGTYTLGVTEGTCTTEAGDVALPAGVPFTITVQGP